ncbi:MAG: PilZ domain-containing protein [Thermodesulfobacteriota bacterium]
MDYLRNIDGPGDTVSSDTGSANADLRLIDSDIEPGQSHDTFRKERVISKKRLVNTLNYIHFQNATIRIHFKNPIDGRTRAFDVRPQPCFGRHVVCLWQKEKPAPQDLAVWELQTVTVFGPDQVISAPAVVRAANERGVCLTLPDTSVQHCQRRVTRHRCKPLAMELTQNGVVFTGVLQDFSAFAFRVQIRETPNAPLQWLNGGNPVHMVVKKDRETLYAGQCKIIKFDSRARRQHVVLASLQEAIQRFSPRVYRSKRMPVTPSPDVVFSHPFTDKLVNLKVIDLSGSGISVEDDEESAMLIPGMIIPVMELHFANSFHVKCRVQVVYRRMVTGRENVRTVRCGIAFLDVAADAHMKLLSMLHQAENKHLYICNKVDIEELWRFFFETGFIYPKKYAFLHPYKNQILHTYERLYTRNSNIARHFTWQEKSSILAHLSMLRFYEKTWLIHHLAARSTRRIGAGIDMLDQVGAFAYDSHRLISNHMDFLICYFRPQNRFPSHFFGGVAQNIENPKACSIDGFVYFHHRKNVSESTLPGSWNLEKPDYDDLAVLENFYEHQSGGLMLQSLDLLPENDMTDRIDLAAEYQKLGLTRERRLFALKKNHRLYAVIMANISDFALNLSDLTNCITMIVTDSQQLPPDIAHRAIAVVARHYDRNKVPVLLYPIQFATDHAMPYDRRYMLWMLNMQHTDDYFKQFNALLTR